MRATKVMRAAAVAAVLVAPPREAAAQSAEQAQQIQQQIDQLRQEFNDRVAALAVVAAIGTAPVAAADEPVATDQPSPPSRSCAQLGAAEYKCASPGNAQLNDAPPVTNFFPQGDG